MNLNPYYCHYPQTKYNIHYIDDIKEALKNKETYSWIRIGDGELAFLEQEYVHPLNQIINKYPWGNSNTYCGSILPNLELRDRLIEAMRNSTLVGVFIDDPVMMNAFEKINIAPPNISYAFSNVYMPRNPQFVNMITKEKVLLVGKDSARYAAKLKEIINLDVIGTIPISDYSEIEACMQQMEKYDFTLALVSAGVNAKIICYEMSKRKNSVYLDMGHAWDNAFHPPGKYDEYYLIPVWQDKDFSANSIVIFNDKLYKNNSGQILNSNPLNDKRWLIIDDNL